MKRVVAWHPGRHLVTCDRCGFTYRNDECQFEPKTNFFVCDDCVDPAHPQVYRTPVSPDKQNVYPVRPRVIDRMNSKPGELPNGELSTLPHMGGAVAYNASQFLGINEANPFSNANDTIPPCFDPCPVTIRVSTLTAPNFPDGTVTVNTNTLIAPDFPAGVQTVNVAVTLAPSFPTTQQTVNITT